MSLGGGSSAGASVTETHGLPEYGNLPDQIENYLQRAKTLSQETYNLYEDVTGNVTYVQDQDTTNSPYNTGVSELAGINKIADRANNGDVALTSARLVASNLLNENGVYVNAYIDAYYDKQVEKVLQNFEENTKPQIDLAASRGGVYGSSGHQLSLYYALDKINEQLTELGTQIYYKEYKRVRQDVHEAAAASISYADNSIRELEIWRKAGLYVREYEQGKLKDAYDAFMREQENQVKQLDILRNAIMSMTGGQKETVTTQYMPGTMTQIAGLALTALPMWERIHISSEEAKIREAKKEQLGLTTASEPMTKDKETTATGGAN